MKNYTSQAAAGVLAATATMGSLKADSTPVYNNVLEELTGANRAFQVDYVPLGTSGLSWDGSSLSTTTAPDGGIVTGVSNNPLHTILNNGIISNSGQTSFAGPGFNLLGYNAIANPSTGTANSYNRFNQVGTALPFTFNVGSTAFANASNEGSSIYVFGQGNNAQAFFTNDGVNYTEHNATFQTIGDVGDFVLQYVPNNDGIVGVDDYVIGATGTPLLQSTSEQPEVAQPFVNARFTAVPEPSTGLLALLGGLGLATRRRRTN